MLTLLEKLYGFKEKEAKRAFEDFLYSLTSGLDAEIKFIGKNDRGWIQIKVLGSDSRVVINYLRKRYGIAQSFTDIHLPMILKGKIVDLGKVGYGLYVDVGLSVDSPHDVLIPLNRLRSHLVDGRKLSLKKIIDLYCLQENFPLLIRLTKIDVKNKKIWAEPSDVQMELFKEWLYTYLDRIIVLGAHHKKINHALRKSRVIQYILKVEQLGFLEHSLLCKLGTDAPGIIKILGRYLPKVALHAFSPRKVKDFLDAPV